MRQSPVNKQVTRRSALEQIELTTSSEAEVGYLEKRDDPALVGTIAFTLLMNPRSISRLVPFCAGVSVAQLGMPYLRLGFDALFGITIKNTRNLRKFVRRKEHH